jgi:hypothetical protein
VVVGVDDIWTLKFYRGDMEWLKINGVQYPAERFFTSFPWKTSPSEYKVEEVECRF